MLSASYILPIRRRETGNVVELTEYLRWLNQQIELIVVDGSPSNVFKHHARAWQGIIHVPPSPAHKCANGKVAGVLTGLEVATRERVVIADDDVRYNLHSLQQVLELLDDAAVVRPQNYFDPLLWHARWDTARSLINRVTGGDWPGTLAVRRSVLVATRGYNGDCLFENLELVRTVRAAGGKEIVASSVFVARRPPDTRHFFSQRVRQAYDEFARPGRLLWQLTLLPLVVAVAIRRPSFLPLLAGVTIAMAEAGRRRDGGIEVFPPSTSLFAPAWFSERAVCSWLAVFWRVALGGAPYGGRVITRSASPPDVLERRVAVMAESA